MMHYTELCGQLKHAGFNCGIFDDEGKVEQPRIYINGYDSEAKIYLFADPKRKQNDFSNPISGYGLHVGLSIEAPPLDKMKRRCKIKHQVMIDLHLKGFALKPIADSYYIGL
jgi:hypothetical protein